MSGGSEGWGMSGWGVSGEVIGLMYSAPRHKCPNF